MSARATILPTTISGRQKERQWLKEIRPRSTATDNSQIRRDEGEAAFALDIALEEVEDIANGDDQADDRNHDHAPPLDAPPLDAQVPGVHAGPAVDVEHHGDHVHRRRDYTVEVSRVSQMILGALVFPGASALMGGVLRGLLPTAWTTPIKDSPPSRFLQTRWGRSIVGGCLLVVFKDAITLYVRWKMAQNHRHRRIVDYHKKKGKPAK